MPLLGNFTKFCIKGIYLAKTVLKLLDTEIYNDSNSRFDTIVPFQNYNDRQNTIQGKLYEKLDNNQLFLTNILM